MVLETKEKLRHHWDCAPPCLLPHWFQASEGPQLSLKENCGWKNQTSQGQGHSFCMAVSAWVLSKGQLCSLENLGEATGLSFAAGGGGNKQGSGSCPDN